MEKTVIIPTSRSTADCSDIVLRETGWTRLVFRPMLVDNPHSVEAAIHGSFLYQRKSMKNVWENTRAIPITKLKGGDGVKIELHSAEILSLFRGLAELYRQHAAGGIPRQVTELVRIDSDLGQLASLSKIRSWHFSLHTRQLGKNCFPTSSPGPGRPTGAAGLDPTPHGAIADGRAQSECGNRPWRSEASNRQMEREPREQGRRVLATTPGRTLLRS